MIVNSATTGDKFVALSESGLSIINIIILFNRNRVYYYDYITVSRQTFGRLLSRIILHYITIILYYGRPSNQL